MLSKAPYYLCMEVVQLRRPFCPLPHVRQQQEAGMLLPHHAVTGSYSIPAGLQGQVRQKSVPTCLLRDSQLRNETRTDPTTYHSIVQVFQWPWGAERDPLVSPPTHPLMPRHDNPYSHHSMGTTSWARARENNITFIKNTVPLFPLDPTSYLLTGVKYYYSAIPSRQVFLSA